MTRLLVFSVCTLAVGAAPVFAQMTTTGTGGSTSPFVVRGTTSLDIAHQVPCDRVRQNSDGSFTIVGTVVYDDQNTFGDTTFGREESMILRARCGHAHYGFSAGGAPVLATRQTRN